MCLILLAWRAHPEYPLIVAANRDEFFARPTQPAHFWTDMAFPDLLAGRDLTAGGTWMGITRMGRFAALTNFREPEDRPTTDNSDGIPSRGRLVSDFLSETSKAEEFLAALGLRATACKAFNLLCGSLDDGLWHYSNRSDSIGGMQRLEPGIYGLSNNLLDTPWPKVAQGKSDLARAMAALSCEAPLFDLLRDDKIHEDAKLPRTGVSLEWERVLSAAFVRAPHYGTRSSTVLKIDRAGLVTFDEQTYLPDAVTGNRNRFRFRLAGNAAS